MKLTEVKILDKKEYRARLDEINNLVEKQDYREALNVVETIEWRRVRSARTLCMVSEIYETASAGLSESTERKADFISSGRVVCKDDRL